MKSIIIVALAVVAAVIAAPPNVDILRSEFVQSPQGEYDFFSELSDGSVRQESGKLKEVFDEDKKPHQVIIVKGSYSYINDQGKPELVNYQADEQGYQAQGDSIPVPPVARR